MVNENYVGHFSQVYGVEEHRLVGGKGDGMRLFQVRNGKGIDFTVSADRCADISRLSFDGINLSYFSPCGYVAPQYYEKTGFDFLDSFTAGFVTTCGLTTIGTPSTDEGESFPLHGNIANVPAESIYYTYGKNEIVIHACIRDTTIFRKKLVLERTIACSTESNTITIRDNIRNEGSGIVPLMLLYHLNIGYPLLDENAEVYIPSARVEPRDERAKDGIGEWGKITPPKAGFVEQCYYHHFKDNKGLAMVYNAKIEKGLSIKYDAEQLSSFVEWKMLGEKDYVLGLEPCNSRIEGRKAAREKGELKFLNPGAEQAFEISIELFRGKASWDASKR
jgi:hypothetical protein